MLPGGPKTRHVAAIPENNRFRQLWNVVLVILLVYVGTLLPYFVSFYELRIGEELPDGNVRITYWIVDTFFYIDLVLNFVFTYEDSSGEEIFDLRKIWARPGCQLRCGLDSCKALQSARQTVKDTFWLGLSWPGKVLDRWPRDACAFKLGPSIKRLKTGSKKGLTRSKKGTELSWRRSRRGREWRKEFSCRKVAEKLLATRCVPESYPRRSRRTPQLPRNCPTVVEQLLQEATFGPHRPKLVDSGQLWFQIGQIQPQLCSVRP